MKSIVWVLLFSSTLMSCAVQDLNGSMPEYTINEIVILNKTNRQIENAQLMVKRFNGIFSCSRILANAQCSTTFPDRPYEANLITVVWTQNGQIFRSNPLSFPVSDDIKPGVAARGVIEVTNQGYDARLQQ